MIDHLIGALFYLHHFDIVHAGVRDNVVLVNHEGKYMLIDREVFGL